MVSFKSTFARFLAAVSVTSYLVSDVVAVPSVELVERKAEAVQAAPHFVTYTDAWISGENGPPNVSAVKGFNTYVLSFWLLSGPADQALEWTLIDAATRSSIKSQYAAAGVKIMVSLFGSTDAPTSSGADPVATANNAAAWIKQYGLDGADVDYEDFNAFNGGTTSAVNWLISFTTQLRAQLPSSSYIISHAPVAPWFEKGYSGGGYLAVHAAVGSLIDWYNVQFYNQGSEYTTCTTLLTTSGGSFPGSSLFEIAANGVPLSKLVIGKPAVAGDASGGAGYISPATLATCVAQAKAQGWNGGVMTWEYPDGNAAWIQTVRGSAFPE